MKNKKLMTIVFSLILLVTVGIAGKTMYASYQEQKELEEFIEAVEGYREAEKEYNQIQSEYNQKQAELEAIDSIIDMVEGMQ